MIRRYMAQGLNRNRCLKICGISKHQFYYEQKGGKRGRKKSRYTMQLIDGQQVKVSNKVVVTAMKVLFKDPKVDYGYHRMTGALQLAGFFINHKKVYRLMKRERLLQPKPERVSKKYVQYRIVSPEAPLRLLEMDIKQVYIQGERRYAYVLTIIDVFTRVVLYWTVGYQMRQAQVQKAWEQIIQHYLQVLNLLAWEVNIEIRSDNGPQFCATKLTAFLKDNYLLQTFTHPYTPQENGHIESFHAILGRDLQGKYFETLHQLIGALKDFYLFYNFKRIHGSTLKIPPVTFWKQWDIGNINREVKDAKKRKVHFSLKKGRQYIQVVLPQYIDAPSAKQAAGNKSQREVLSLNFLTLNGSENLKK